LRRQDLKDVVSIYDAESFEVIKVYRHSAFAMKLTQPIDPRPVNLHITRIPFQNIELDTVDAQDIVISPNGGFIAAYDVPLLVSHCISRLLLLGKMGRFSI
jgi:hypothetical protein